MLGDFEPIRRDEVMYRRILRREFDPAVDRAAPDSSFSPSSDDRDGISVWRASRATLARAARGTPGNLYWIARLLAGDILDVGLTLRPDERDETERGHCVIPEIATLTRRNERRPRQHVLQRRVRDIVDPYLSENPPPLPLNTMVDRDTEDPIP